MSSACGAVTGTTTISVDDSAQTSSANTTTTESAQSGTPSSAQGSTRAGNSSTSSAGSVDDAVASLDELSDVETELVLEAFEDIFASDAAIASVNGEQEVATVAGRDLVTLDSGGEACVIIDDGSPRSQLASPAPTVLPDPTHSPRQSRSCR